MPKGPQEPFPKRALRGLKRLFNPPRTELEFMAAVVEAEREGRTPLAARLCERGLERFPNDYYLLMKRLVQLREQGNRPAVEGLLARAEELCPPTAATWSSVGEEYAYLGDMDRAIVFFRRALERTPGSAIIREKLAMALVSQHKMDEGIQELSDALGREPENTDRRDLLLQVMLQAEDFQGIMNLVGGLPESDLTWESLMCLSMARARLEGADPFVEGVTE
ncbi:MAG: hypothetical protein M3Y56_06970 [Armatimonadota bacterium]|nr:hypothetical protein [Armatimonadota bacterium]